MDTDLLEQLEVAGFLRNPQFITEGLFQPTLGELVEQCVRLSDTGNFLLECRDYDHWYATSEPDVVQKRWFEGGTPEDAVAGLWLRLKSP